MSTTRTFVSDQMKVKGKTSSPRIPVLNFHLSVLRSKTGTFSFPGKKKVSICSFYYCNLHRLRYTVSSEKNCIYWSLTFCIRDWSVTQDGNMPCIGEKPSTPASPEISGALLWQTGEKSMSKIYRDKCLLGFKWGIRHSIFCFHQALIFLCPGGENIHYYWLLSKVYRM